MSESIEVVPFEDAQYSSIDALHVFHSLCSRKEMNKHRNPATDIYSFSCGCGFAFTLPQMGVAAQDILLTGIDSLPRVLAAGTLDSATTKEVSVRAREGA